MKKLSKKRVLIIILFATIIGFVVWARNSPNLLDGILPTHSFRTPTKKVAGVTIPKPIGLVNDFEAVFAEKEELELDSILRVANDQSEVLMVLVTIDSASLGEFSMKEFNLQLGKSWAVSDSGKNNGIIILVSQQLKKIDIRVGAAIEGRYTDAFVKSVIDTSFIPRVMQDDLKAGVKSCISALRR